ncbi:preprotein translocase subunit SecE [Methylophaga lonarensis MPL]|uniref:Protein translocase subunit SecE n=1 Tax=Methylophaga lonarensis MPL TaxID=1286106 RepID=M7P1N0_9GAMM|nr:preprotein translocase subunit SecE [Methylophaga lonarensis]EMR13396.1 preprotein translocase subunit SecE [Methylophaga lonarensis MPL]
MADNIKLIIAAVLMVAAIALFYTYTQYSTLLRVLGLLAVAGVSVFIASRTAVGANVLSYFGDTQVEVRKVVWPTRQETLQTTLVVIVMVIIVAIMLWGVDSLLGWGVRSLTV